MRTPQSSAISPDAPAKFEIQTLSFPSTAAAQGPGSPLPVNGEPGNGVPSGLSRFTLPPNRPPFCSDTVFVR
jgi:hypothetical protein